MPKALELTTKRFGRLVVVEREPRKPHERNVMWRCQCDCGNMAVVAAANIGKTTFSCGCIKKESAARLLREGQYSVTHGLTGIPEHHIWFGMKQRCYNSNHPFFSYYGGRGIKICDRWLNDFRHFIGDMGYRPTKGHTIDRINNDGDYEPSNCRWVSRKQQARNRSSTNFITIDGEKKCVKEWCEFLNIDRTRPYELTRPTGRKRNGPPQFKTVEEALLHLYKQKR